MFLYTDPQIARHKRIRSFLANDPFVAVILAATDFEWTTRRAILALASLPTKEVNSRFESERRGGPSGLNNHWKNLVQPRLKDALPSIVPDWEFLLKRAYHLRNNLVHGAEGKVTSAYAAKIVDSLLGGSSAVAKYAESHGERIFGKKIQRIKSRS